MDSGPHIHAMRIDAGADTLYAELISRDMPDPMDEAPETVVFCHGLGGNHASWFQQVPHFARTFRVLTWDQRGFGNSSDRAGLSSPAQAVADLRTILQQSGLGRVHLVGQSMGGWAALGYAVAFPEDVASLVLSDSLGGLSTEASRASLDAYIQVRATSAALPPRLGIHPAFAADLTHRDPSRAFLFQQIASFSTPSPDMLLRLRESEIGIDSVAGLDIPMHFVFGDADHVFPAEAAADVAAQIPGAHLTVLAHAGHSAYFERPSQFNAAVMRHLVSRRRG